MFPLILNLFFLVNTRKFILYPHKPFLKCMLIRNFFLL